MIRTGRPAPLGATTDKNGTNFAVFSSVAERVELCLFDATGTLIASHNLPACDDGVWHGYLAGVGAGQCYGYRVHGPYKPDDGLRCNPAKLLLDPYARALTGPFTWNDAVFDYTLGRSGDELRISTLDSAPFVLKSLVCGPIDAMPAGPSVPWSETIFYEANVRGFSMRHPALEEVDRGTFDGMRHKAVIDYIKALGITSLELMPVHQFIDERHLADKQLRNYWGYNSIAFFSPCLRYAKTDPQREFRDMVRALHDAGIEVILDVVYNHTAEGDRMGPSLSFRGLDNLAYYSTEPSAPGTYINDTGCGNTLNADSPQVQRLVLDSLHYWHINMGVDGFRFDLAPVLGRHGHGFMPDHPLLRSIENDATLSAAKLVAEPWDPGPGGYQLGNFSGRWAEWNDRYRDSVRGFWLGNATTSSDFAKRLHGSADVFEAPERATQHSVNLVTCHDGFTMADLVSYEHKHNEANGERNRDGHNHNLSTNHGVEGHTDDAAILGVRRRHRLNLLATLLFSQGTPLLLAGDEFGHSQKGNNNAYAQDNEIAWLDWRGLENDPEFTADVRALIRLRREQPLLRIEEHVHGQLDGDDATIEIRWLRPDGRPMSAHDWHEEAIFSLVLSATDMQDQDTAIAILINGSDTPCPFAVPDSSNKLQLAFSSTADLTVSDEGLELPGLTLALLVSQRD
jgi:glycogen operon protein